jgi:hypothetical protein
MCTKRFSRPLARASTYKTRKAPEQKKKKKKVKKKKKKSKIKNLKKRMNVRFQCKIIRFVNRKRKIFEQSSVVQQEKKERNACDMGLV